MSYLHETAAFFADQELAWHAWAVDLFVAFALAITNALLLYFYNAHPLREEAQHVLIVAWLALLAMVHIEMYAMWALVLVAVGKLIWKVNVKIRANMRKFPRRNKEDAFFTLLWGN
jgi:hypothetical protein